MSQLGLNPYPLVGSDYTSGLTSVITALPPTPTVDQLVDEVYNYIISTYYVGIAITQQLRIEIKSVAYTAINNYINRNLPPYKPLQRRFINMMTGSALNTNTVDSIADRILDIEDNVSKSGLSVEEQTPLLLATMIGSSGFTYFLTAIGTPGSWLPYFTTALTSPTANLPFWISSAVEGSLMGTRTTNKGMIESTIEIVSVEIISTLIAALTITVGKVIFKWIPKVQVPNTNIVSVPMKSNSNCNCGCSKNLPQKGGAVGITPLGNGGVEPSETIINCSNLPGGGSNQYMCCDQQSGACYVCDHYSWGMSCDYDYGLCFCDGFLEPWMSV